VLVAVANVPIVNAAAATVIAILRIEINSFQKIGLLSMA
jgi:hypothetical protein